MVLFFENLFYVVLAYLYQQSFCNGSQAFALNI
jgi:hypothetical protein